EFLTADTAQGQSSEGPAEKSKMANGTIDENAVYLLLPLQDTVIFPGMVITLPVENPAVASAIEEMLPSQRQIVLSALKEGREEAGGPEDLHRVGAFGRIMQMMRRNETLVLAVEAQERVSLEHLHPREGFWQVN